MPQLQTYREDIRKIAAHARASADGFTDVATFVVATIGVQFSNHAEKRLAAINAADWSRVRNATTAKRAIEYLRTNRHDLHARVTACTRAVDAIEILLDVPGLDTVKSGFVAQCMGFDVGCLDVHNLRRFNLNKGAFSASRLKTREKRREKVAHYVDVCDRLGGSVYLWAQWCEFIAAKNPHVFTDGAEVSHAHVRLCNALYQ